MINNLDEVLFDLFALIKDHEDQLMKARVQEAVSTLRSADIINRQTEIHEINKAIIALQKSKQQIEYAVAGLPQELQFHTREGVRQLLEEINKKIRHLILIKKTKSRPR